MIDLKLFSNDFMQIMKTYKSIKTICKSQNNQVTLSNGYARIDIFGEDTHVQLITDAEIDEYEKEINFNSESLDKLVKLKVKDSVEVNEKLILDGRVVYYQSSDDRLELIDTSKFVEVFTCKATEFKEALKAVKPAIAKETSRPVLNNVLLDIDTLVAVDGYRIFTRKLNATGDANMLIKQHTVDILLKLLPTKGNEVLTIYQGDKKKYYVTWGDYTIVDDAGEGEFLKWEQVSTNDAEYILTCDREQLIDELQWVIDCVGSSNKPLVEITLREDEIMIGEKGLDAEYTKHEGAPGKHFKELKIAFNCKYLIESLKSYKEDEVMLSFITSLTPVIINKSDLILPVRMNK